MLQRVGSQNNQEMCARDTLIQEHVRVRFAMQCLGIHKAVVTILG